MAALNYQVIPDRSSSHQMFIISHVITKNRFHNAEYQSSRTRDELLAGYRILKKRMANVAGCTVEIPFTYGNFVEIGVVGPCVLSGVAIAVHAMRVSASRVDDNLIEFHPAYEKLLIVPAAQAVSQTFAPRPDFPVLSESVLAYLEDFGQDYLEQFTNSERVHPDFHVRVDLSYPSVIRVLSPQETLLNYLEVVDASLVPAAARALKIRLEEEELMEIDDEPDSEFDLFNETLAKEFPERFVDVSLEDLATAYITFRYRPTVSLPFKGRDEEKRMAVEDVREEFVMVEGEERSGIVEVGSDGESDKSNGAQ